MNGGLIVWPRNYQIILKIWPDATVGIPRLRDTSSGQKVDNIVK
jgi:hypothetical protein